jgi:hypothetical protein
VVNGLHTTTKYLRGAAGIGLGTTVKYMRRATSAAAMNQNVSAGHNWAKAHTHKNWVRIQSPTPGHVPRSVCVWGPTFLAVFRFPRIFAWG